MFYNVVLVSVVQQSVSAAHIRVSPLFWISFTFRSLKSSEQWHPTPGLLPGKSTDRGAWWAAVHGVAKSRTRLSDFSSLFTFMHWRRKWQPTAVFLPGESQGRGSLVGRRLWGRTESGTTEATQQQTIRWSKAGLQVETMISLL